MFNLAKKINTVGIVIAVFLIAGAIFFAASSDRDNNITKNIDQPNKNMPSDGDKDKLSKPSTAVEFAQITSMRLNNGEQTFEAFRISRGGMVERAHWNSSGYLLGYSGPLTMNDKIFDKAVSSLNRLNSSKSPAKGSALGRPGFRLDIVTQSDSGVKAASTTKMPDDIAILLNELRRGVKAVPAKTGWYIWTQPYPRINKPDIDLAVDGRDSVVAKALIEANKTGRLIIKVDDSIQKFISGERAYRMVFEAKLGQKNLIFGVLTAKQ
ncbi:MAG: hypothetical protein GXP44_02920 [bacterium]|nr:hypothetical protein [bacterium]